MARQRSESTTTDEGAKMPTGFLTEISADEINQLLSESRQKGQYLSALKEYLETDLAGVPVDMENGPFGGKKSPSIKTGFEGAKKKLIKLAEEKGEDTAEFEAVRVIVKNEKVYLVRAALV